MEVADGLLSRARGLAKNSLYRNASALILSNVSNGVLGLAYWVIAARLYSADDLGRGAAGVSALLFVSLLGWAGLQGALIRFIPAQGRSVFGLVRANYLAASSIGVLAGVVFLLIAHEFIADLDFLSASWGVAFIAAIVAWCVFSLQDGVLIGLRRAEWVPAENAIFSVLKMGLLVVFAAFGAGPWGIVGSWALGAAVLVAPVNLLLFLRLLPQHVERSRQTETKVDVRSVARFSAGNHVSQLLAGLPDAVMPVIVLQLAGSQASAFFYAPRTIILALRQVAISIANALTAEGAAAEVGLERLTRRAAIFAGAVFVPIVVLLLVAAGPILSMFGSEYAENGDSLLRYMALGVFPLAFTMLYMAVARVRQQVARLVALGAVWSTASLGVSFALIPGLGITGAGIAWLAAQVLVAVFAGVMSLLGLLAGGTAARTDEEQGSPSPGDALGLTKGTS